jgi:hypothetical protein
MKVLGPRGGLICPRCEKPLGAEHDEPGCRRRMSRRLFFGLAIAPLAAAIAAKLPQQPITLDLLYGRGNIVPEWIIVEVKSSSFTLKLAPGVTRISRSSLGPGTLAIRKGDRLRLPTPR